MHFRVAVFLVCIASINAFADENQFSAGFIAITPTAQTPPMGVWYPSTDAETAGKLGPFRPTWAWGGETANGIFPVIVLSHGHTGRYRNHRQTAATLARNGYIVVAPEHLRDRQMISIQKTIPVVTARAEELKLALSTVKRHPLIGKIANENRIGLVGYSLGTMTALYASGTTPQMARFTQHCKLHNQADPNFCGGGWMSIFLSMIQNTLSWLKENDILKPRTNEIDTTNEFLPMESPLAADAIALIAPVGVAFDKKELQAQTAAIALFRLGDDAELRYPYHAEYLHNSLGENPHVYRVYNGVHHYAFISPFPQWLLEEEDIPVALDPQGFERADFIHDINNDIVNFFQQNL